ncbi:YjcZ family sporulation protein [Neobacillus mesonae]|nr:YjcZ family sporulation protein [Neobacillus mesonae]MCM3567770.1 YjcZ family sporulation protein [Neobacillus mesonae]
MSDGYGSGAGFALIVVLFILLIIVGAGLMGGYGFY